MTNLTTPAPAVKRELREDTSGERDLILSSLRVAATRSRLITNTLDIIGVALRQKQIDCAGALEWQTQRPGPPPPATSYTERHVDIVGQSCQ